MERTWLRDFTVKDIPNLVGMIASPRFFQRLAVFQALTSSFRLWYSLFAINCNRISTFGVQSGAVPLSIVCPFCSQWLVGGSVLFGLLCKSWVPIARLVFTENEYGRTYSNFVIGHVQSLSDFLYPRLANHHSLGTSEAAEPKPKWELVEHRFSSHTLYL